MVNLFNRNDGTFAQVGPGDIAGNAWNTYTPIIGSGSGTIGTHAAAGQYTVIGNTLFFFIEIVITSIGSAGGYITATLPSVPARDFIGNGREATTGAILTCGPLGGTGLYIIGQNSAFIGANGYTLRVTGFYPTA